MASNTSGNPIAGNSDMSDEEFAQELRQLQEFITSSFSNLRSRLRRRRRIESLETEAEGAGGSRFLKRRNTGLLETAVEDGGGGSSQSTCDICVETKDRDLIFPIKNCTHTYCIDCISRYASVVMDRRKMNGAAAATAFICPGYRCGSVFDADLCRKLLPSDVVGKWDVVLCESAIREEERVYCPYKDCSAMLADEGGPGMIREAECPYCHRLFCAKCKVRWHAGIGCEEFMKLRKDEREREDIMLLDLAKEKKWMKCSKCNFFVEKIDGCHHVFCRCGYEFCYSCGRRWGSIHARNCVCSQS